MHASAQGFAHPDADVVLRDGSTVHVRPFVPQDAAAVQRFYARLSPESLQNRFGGLHAPNTGEVEHLCSNDPTTSYALVAERAGRIVAVVQYYVNRTFRDRA